MPAIQQWAFSICAAMVAAGLAHMLMPKSSMEKVMRLVVSVFFLCCLLSPVVFRNPSILVDIRLETEEEVAARSKKLDQLAEEQAMTAARSTLEKMIREKFAQRGIKVQAVTIHISTNGQNDSWLDEVELTVPEEDWELSLELAQELEKELGVYVWLERG